MKKLLFGFAAFAISFSLLGQETVLKNKNGKIILPEAGDFAIGISANPLFNYLGNLFSNQNNFFGLGLMNNQLFGKYFLTDKSAIHLKFGINVYHDFNNSNTGNPISTKYVFIDGALGYQKRGGEGRLQHYYGGEILMSNNLIKTDFNNVAIGDVQRRIDDSGLGLGLRGFAGLEYFFVPKISVGGEIGLSFRHYFSGKIVEEISRSYKDRVYDKDYTTIYTDILNGQVFLLFHF